MLDEFIPLGSYAITKDYSYRIFNTSINSVPFEGCAWGDRSRARFPALSGTLSRKYLFSRMSKFHLAI